MIWASLDESSAEKNVNDTDVPLMVDDIEFTANVKLTATTQAQNAEKAKTAYPLT